MVKTITIRCPLCDEESELFLSINPSVIVLNCPECWTPLMYDRDKIHILSENELDKITAPSTESIINNLLKSVSDNNTFNESLPQVRNKSSYQPNKAKTNLMVKVPQIGHQRNRTIISSDDILDLRIDLAQCGDVLEFLNMV